MIEALIWGLQQDDIDLKLLVLQLLQEFYADAKRALPAVRALISDNEDRLVRVTAINTLNVMQDTSEEPSSITRFLVSVEVAADSLRSESLFRFKWGRLCSVVFSINLKSNVLILFPTG